MADDSYFSDADFLRKLILGEADSLAPAALARLTVLWARYSRSQDAGMADLCRRAFEVRHAAVERAEEAADRAYLEGMLDGNVNLLSESVFPCIEPMFAKYAEDSEMFALLEKAATVFGHAVQEIAARALASWTIDDARRRAGGEDVDD